MNLPHHMAYDFIVHKDHKISVKFFFPVRGINFRTQRLACPLINHRVTIHHNIFLKSLPCEFPNRIIHKSLIIHMLINDLLLSKFTQAYHTGGDIQTKNNLLIPFDGVFDRFFKLFLCFHTISTVYIQLFGSSNSNVLFIYY